jgi:opacity protein-like surface antigen
MLASAAMLLMSSASGMAADLGGMKGGSIKDGYAPAHVYEASRGIYLRGDYGWASQDLGSMYEPPNYNLSQVSIANTHMFGLGLGYYFSANVRGDVTFDWRRSADARGSVNDHLATVQGERQFSIKNMVTLANLYYDFDTRSHFTPYIGVGLGFSRNTTSSGSVVISGCDAIDPLTGTPACSADFDGKTKTSAAGALMAGFSAKLKDRLHFDAGYRFLYMGDSHTGDIRITRTAVPVGPAPTSTPDPFVNDQFAHEFRVGLRWDIK